MGFYPFFLVAPPLQPQKAIPCIIYIYITAAGTTEDKFMSSQHGTFFQNHSAKHTLLMQTWLVCLNGHALLRLVLA